MGVPGPRLLRLSVYWQPAPGSPFAFQLRQAGGSGKAWLRLQNLETWAIQTDSAFIFATPPLQPCSISCLQKNRPGEKEDEALAPLTGPWSVMT